MNINTIGLTYYANQFYCWSTYIYMYTYLLQVKLYYKTVLSSRENIMICFDI